MRILQVMAGARYGGAEAFFVRLVPALSRAGAEQRAVIRSHPERARVLKVGGIPTLERRFGGPLDLKTRWSLRREIGDFRPQIVMTWMSRASAMCPGGRFVHIARLGGYYDLKYYRRCDYLVANTPDIVRYLIERGFPKERVRFLPNFVNNKVLAPLVRPGLSTPEGAPLLLAMGRLHPNKAFDVMIRAMPLIPDAYLWLAGEGPERRSLEELAESLGVMSRIRFLGWREDVAALLAACDVFVCPSRHEPLGNVILEAWARSVPVVAAASEGPRAIMSHGENGLLVPIDDPERLADAITVLLDRPDLATALAAAGRTAYEADYTEEKVVARYMAFFESVAGGA